MNRITEIVKSLVQNRDISSVEAITLIGAIETMEYLQHVRDSEIFKEFQKTYGTCTSAGLTSLTTEK